VAIQLVDGGSDVVDMGHFVPVSRACVVVTVFTADRSQARTSCEPGGSIGDFSEWLLVREESVTMGILTSDDRQFVPLVAGQFTIVPKRCWHRYTDIVELYYTPRACEESSDGDPRERAAR
jgi:hypothetical protein